MPINMTINAIQPSDISGKGVIGLPDTPALTTLQMQEKFEEISTDVLIPKINEIIAQVNTLVVLGGGDMYKQTYDTNNNGIVDNSEDCTKLSGCWIEFTDEDGNPTDEPYIHWTEEVE